MLHFFEQAIQRIEAIPGVERAGGVDGLPFPGTASGNPVRIPGGSANEDVTFHARNRIVLPGYHQTMGIPLLAGRFFTESDYGSGERVALINETMARQFWPDEDPLGARLTVGARLTANEPEFYEVVGVVGDVHDTTLDAGMEPYLYVPYQQLAWPYMSFMARTEIDPEGLIDVVRAEVTQVTGDEAPFALSTLEDYVDRMIRPRRSVIVLLSLFAVAAVALATLGLYGVLSYMVAQRTQEIGVRIALGAPARRVLRLVMYQGMLLAVIGLALGLGAALGATRFVSGMLFGVTTLDPTAFVAAFMVLAAVAVVACYLPARRATKVDPMVALRCE